MNENTGSTKDILFSKLIPALNENPFSSSYEGAPDIETQSPEQLTVDENDPLSSLRSKLFGRETKTNADTYTTVNVVEGIVLSNVDSAITKFNACSCDKCRCEIIARALNSLPPKYVVCDPASPLEYESDIPQKQIVDALVGAVLFVRRNPTH